MKKMKFSAMLLSFAAASVFAQATAPAAKPAEQPAKPVAEAPKAEAAKPAAEAKKAEEAKPVAEAPKAEAAKPAAEAKKAEEAKPAAEAPKAEAAKPAAEAKKVEEAKPVAEAPKAEAAKPAAEAKKAEEAKPVAEAPKAEAAKPAEEGKKVEEAKPVAEAPKAETAKPAEEAKKAEEAKPVAEAPKAEEAKTAENAPKTEDKGEVSAAAGNALDLLKASMNEATSKAEMKVNFSGEVEFDVYTGDVINDADLNHSYASTFDLNVDVQFNDKWSAFVGLEADGESTSPAAIYNGAYIQYKPADFFNVKVGDLTFSEGAFKSYYGYDDPAYNAAGMKEHDIRGVQITLAGLELGFGFGRGENDTRGICYAEDNCVEESGKNYDAHVAYEFDYAGQHLRPYVDYKSYQTLQHNELHAGVDAGVSIGGFAFRAVYGFHMDYLMDDEDMVKGQDWTSTAHTVLAEPSFEVAMFQIKTTAFYAFIDEGDAGNLDLYSGEIPEYFFLYAEPALKLAEFIKLGIPVEYHTNTLDDDDSTQETLDVGGRVYISPVENLELTAFGMVDIAMGDNEDDTTLKFGVETVFSF
ncbi:MAG: hypothetical protein IIU83_09035 [Fibrobacteraceae bacterium]|nr:hypothetical protein [Fibrobacteraceae bacterium]